MAQTRAQQQQQQQQHTSKPKNYVFHGLKSAKPDIVSCWIHTMLCDVAIQSRSAFFDQKSLKIQPIKKKEGSLARAHSLAHFTIVRLLLLLLLIFSLVSWIRVQSLGSRVIYLPNENCIVKHSSEKRTHDGMMLRLTSSRQETIKHLYRKKEHEDRTSERESKFDWQWLIQKLVWWMRCTSFFESAHDV